MMSERGRNRVKKEEEGRETVSESERDDLTNTTAWARTGEVQACPELLDELFVVEDEVEHLLGGGREPANAKRKE